MQRTEVLSRLREQSTGFEPLAKQPAAGDIINYVKNSTDINDIDIDIKLISNIIDIGITIMLYECITLHYPMQS